MVREVTVGASVAGVPLVAFVAGEGDLYVHIHAGMHGDEPESSEVADRLLVEVMQGTLAPSVPFVFFPRINPDGLAKFARTNNRGVDLNRNFPTANWSTEHRAERNFPGSGTGSEPETRAVLEVLERFPPRAVITIHTWIPQVNFDGGEDARALAAFLAERNGYEVTSDIGYPTPGSFGTYLGKERNVPTITLEMPENTGGERCIIENGAALRALISSYF